MMGSGLLSFAAFAVIAYFAWRWWTDQGSDDGSAGVRPGRGRGHDRAYRVLRERFANGEIDEDEFQARKRVLFD